jgi:undecaprenyl diphosphate synthase
MTEKNLLSHVAIIMDGNRRWAKNRHLPSFIGHKQAVDQTLEALIDEGLKRKIQYMTFWAWSTENWQRKESEVSAMMKLFEYVIKTKTERFHKKGAKLQVIGDIRQFSTNLQNGIADALEKTKHNTKITVNFALNYGGRDEIVRAIHKWYEKSCLSGKQTKLIKEDFYKYLDTSQIPDPDMIIRTGGEMRLSGFLLWQSEYSELYFTETLFPDFTPEEFGKAVVWYEDRKRRFGK